MTERFVLVHSPLVGPATWSWVADELRSRGRAVVVPVLAKSSLPGTWQGCVAVVSEAVRGSGDVVLVGHSGAGPLLPAIAESLDAPPRQLVFVDAGVPPAAGNAALAPDDFRTMLGEVAHDGVLPPWSDWFGPDVVEMLVPDGERRRAVLGDLPRVPLSYFDDPVPMPENWSATKGGYLLLSESYRPDAEAAAAFGWPVVEMIGGHLDLVSRPGDVADALLSLAEA